MSNIFDKYRKEYDDWYDKHKFEYLSEIEAIRKVLPKKGKGIEIGVGTGRFAAPLGIKYGVEPSEKMLEFAEKRGIRVYKGVAEELPFPDKTFNYVLFVTTLCFVNDPRKAIKEANRVLHKNGSIIIGMIDKNSTLGKKYLQEKKNNRFQRHARFYSVSQILRMLEETELKISKIIQTIFEADCNRIQKFRKGSGDGLFVVIKTIKQ
ncbi:MAG: class I SAM-dependent methyltransferase [Elusimicrobia bacterium]|nr:class I SAM-dependent methyltransferase [Elusimicrobiota bacterium]